MTNDTPLRGVCGIVQCVSCPVRLVAACAGCRERDAEARTRGSKRCAILACSEARGQDSCLHCDDFPCSVFRSSGCLFSHADREAGSPIRCNVTALSHNPSDTSSKFIGRLATYLMVAEHRQRLGHETATSAEFACALGIKPHLVRRDLLSLGHFGVPHVGFRLDMCIEALRKTLNLKSIRNLVWVGLPNFDPLEQFIERLESMGCRVVAVLDDGVHGAPRTKSIGAVRVFNFAETERIVKNLAVVGAVIARDDDRAQLAADVLIRLGIKSILNLTDVPLEHPADVFVKSIDLSQDIMLFSFYCGDH